MSLMKTQKVMTASQLRKEVVAGNTVLNMKGNSIPMRVIAKKTPTRKLAVVLVKGKGKTVTYKIQKAA